jgi:hypothetical protein
VETCVWSFGIHPNFGGFGHGLKRQYVYSTNRNEGEGKYMELVWRVDCVECLGKEAVIGEIKTL